MYAPIVDVWGDVTHFAGDLHQSPRAQLVYSTSRAQDPRARKRTNEHQFTIEKLFESYGGSRYQGSADTEVFVQFLK